MRLTVFNASGICDRSDRAVRQNDTLAVGLLLLCAAAGCREANVTAPTEGAGATEEAHVTVRVQAAELRQLGRTVTALGRCEALPKKLAILTPAVEGQVGAILVEQGQRVTAGEPIVQLDPTLAEADLAEKQAARNSLGAALKLLESVPRPKEQEANKLSIEQGKIAVARAEAMVERLQPLRARNEISEQQLFEAEQALKQAHVQQQTAEAQFDVLMLGPRPEAAAEAQAKIVAAEEAVKTSQAKLELHTIRAPIDGVLDSLTCRPGQTITIGTPIGEIVDNSQLLAVAWLPVDNGRSVRDGQDAVVRIDAASSTSQPPREMAGRVVFVGRVADPQTGNIPVHVLLDNLDGQLIVGQTLALRILVEPPAPTLVVPADAIHDEGDGPAVTVVRDDKAIVLHPQLGTAQAGWIAVSGTDLTAGESVIVQGAYNLPDETPVKVESAAP